ncbi:MAG: membrane protein insertion efficiency factor YidD [Bacillota bacterium]
MQRIIIQLLRFYQQNISLLTAGCCRFRPTCSEYAVEAVEKYGALRGGYLTLGRILRCHPLGSCGYDPVP